MKHKKELQERRKKMLHHINRIQGQINTLKEYIETDRECSDIAQLSTSIAKSFDTLRTKTLEGFIVTELLAKKEITQKKKELKVI